MLKTKLTMIMLLIIFLFTAALSFISIYNIKKFQDNLSKEVSHLALNQIKTELKDYLEILIQNLDNLQKIYSINPKEITKKETDRLFLDYLIPIYEKYQKDPHIKDILLEIIKNYRYKISPFGKSKGFFIVVENGKIISHIKKECIGKDINKLQPTKKYLIKNISNIYQGFFKAKCKGEDKYIFIKYFKPFNWIIMTTISQKDIDVTENVIYNIIKKIRFGNKNYFFGYKKVGDEYVFVFHPYLKGKLDVNERDIKGKLFKKELLEKALNGGGYVTYYFKNLATNKIEEKITYATYYPKLQLILAVGTYITHINSTIVPMENEINKAVINNILQTVFISILILAISFIAFYVLISKFLTTPIKELNEAINSVKHIESGNLEDIIKEFSEFINKVEDELKNVIKHLKGI